ncbi:hypothetical protein Ccrd_005361 [Cynara cardunculus var. scolymus]|uniref:Uncharacterized protein n=1 Tax=Cynara cardunculus var. scolymus TaxID=59895 RepID=A0A103XKW5_CYNCS|nr:hypothetical protein Ccrd_005361 [Cynara cardunculus var. scolymus]
MGRMGLERLMVSVKTRLIRSLKIWKAGAVAGDHEAESYNKIQKSDSMRLEIRSRKARKLIQQTLKLADHSKP